MFGGRKGSTEGSRPTVWKTAVAFGKKRAMKSGNVATDGVKMTSYRYFLLGVWTGFSRLALNATDHSVTTRRHMDYVRRNIPEHCKEVMYLAQDDMEQLARIIERNNGRKTLAIYEASPTNEELESDFDLSMKTFRLKLEKDYPDRRRILRKELKALDTWLSKTRMFARL